jgi:hypothetical protein
LRKKKRGYNFMIEEGGKKTLLCAAIPGFNWCWAVLTSWTKDVNCRAHICPFISSST